MQKRLLKTHPKPRLRESSQSVRQSSHSRKIDAYFELDASFTLPLLEPKLDANSSRFSVIANSSWASDNQKLEVELLLLFLFLLSSLAIFFLYLSLSLSLY